VVSSAGRLRCTTLFQRLPDSAAERFALVKQYARTWCGQTVLTAQTEERLAEAMAWGGGSGATEKPGNIHKADAKARLKLTVEGERDTVSPKPKQVRAVLDRMTPEGGPGHCVLEGRGDDYAQVAGGSGVFTAEWREYSGGSFHHWKAGLAGQPTASEVAIPTNGYVVTVRENER
jgi:hypothetical protein